jgi:ribose/xylose/arabinose/galactoside ABC-type transport system permease subunit
MVFAGLIIILGISSPNSFLTGENFMNVLRQASSQMSVAIGMTFVLVLGGIDLSVGSVANLCGTLSAGFIAKAGMDMGMSIVFALLIGLGCGVINGIIVAKLKIQPFIATLAMMSSAKGASLLYSGGTPISSLPDAYINLGRGYIGGVLPISVLIMIVVIIYDERP